MDPLDLQAVSKLTDITVTLKSAQTNNHNNSHQNQSTPTTPNSTLGINPMSQFLVTDSPTTSLSSTTNLSNLSKYGQLLIIIEEMGREIRPTYSGTILTHFSADPHF
jgi:hypothetical protein